MVASSSDPSRTSTSAVCCEDDAVRKLLMGMLDRVAPPGRDRIVDLLLSGRPSFERKLGSGVILGIDPTDRIERRFAIRSYERPLLRYIERELRPGDAVIEGGGHVGYIALHAAVAVAPTGLVVAVEPDPANLVRLRANLDRNALPVVIEAAALSREIGTARFTRDLTHGETGWGSLLTDPGERSEVIEVPTTTIDALADGIGDRRLRMIKLDVQGAEYDALLGATETLTTRRPVIVVETVDVWWGAAQTTTVADVRNLLRDHGYREGALARDGRLVDPSPGAATGVFVPD